MVLAGGAARAQTLTVGVSNGVPNVGTVVNGASGDTVLRVTPAGAVTVQSGTGTRVTTGGVTTPLVTVHCTDGNGSSKACAGKLVSVKIGAGSATLPARTMSNFTVAMGTASASGAVPGTPNTSLSFKINAVPSGGTRTFSVGMDMGLAAGATTGVVNPSFYVWVDFATPSGSISAAGAGAIRVIRPLSMTKTSDLAFGRVVRPLTGAGGSVSVTTAGARVVTGAGGTDSPVALSSSFSAASYTVTGEGGQTLAIGVPSSFGMSNGSSTLQVTTSTTAIGIIGLTNNLGTSGVYSFSVGGTFPITPSTPSGAYTGTFPVTVAYN
jgi:hypothetical protein